MTFISENKIKFINDRGSRYFSYYLNGFPRNFLIYDILPVQNLMLGQRENVTNYFKTCDNPKEECILSRFENSTSISSVFLDNLYALKKISIASASDFLCVINYEEGRVGLCSLDFLKTFKSQFDFFFDGDDHLEVVYLYYRCLIHGISLSESKNVRDFHHFCPNPCKPIAGYENNPCVTKKNTKNDDCIIVDEKFILFDNNYKCNCKLNYEWDVLKEECVPVKGSCYGERRCNQNNTISCNIHMHSKEEFALLGYDYEINCECIPSYMGPDCSFLRNSCIENYFKKYPSGNAACGLNGKCIPMLGTNNYTCECNSGWHDDNSNEFLDCYEFRDKCSQVYCFENGYCKSSVDNQKAICVCNQNYTGSYCHIPRVQWLEWEAWSSCEPTCGFDRIRKRSRKCPKIRYTNEPGDNSTLSCYFNGDLGSDDFQLCEFVPCPIEMEWSEWESWSDCSKNCDHGYKKRIRQCIFQYDMNDIQLNENMLFRTPCIGPSNDFKYCNLGKCSGNGVDYVLISIICLFILKFFFIIYYYSKYFYKIFKDHREKSSKLRGSFIKNSRRSKKSINLERYSVDSLHKNSLKRSIGKESIISLKIRNSLRSNGERRSIRDLSKLTKESLK